MDSKANDDIVVSDPQNQTARRSEYFVLSCRFFPEPNSPLNSVNAWLAGCGKMFIGVCTENHPDLRS
jgi:hypothetical protein